MKKRLSKLTTSLRLHISLAAVVFLVVASPAYADAPRPLPANECYLDPSISLQNCTSSGPLTSNNYYVGARSNPNLPGGGYPGNPIQWHQPGTFSQYPIDIQSSNDPKAPGDWHLCRFIYNTSVNNSYFIPFNTKDEWNALVNNAPADLTLIHCARPATATIMPGTNCVSSVPLTAVFDLGYGQFYPSNNSQNTVLPESATFQCNYSPQRPVLNWYETVSVTYLATLDSDDYPNVSNWIIKSVSFSGSITNPNTGNPNLADGASDADIADATTAAKALAADDNSNGSQTHEPAPVSH